MHPMPLDHCLGCGKLFDEATQVGRGNAAPRPGDATICLECGHVMMFDKNRRVREPTGRELIDLAGDLRIMMTKFTIEQIKRERSQ